MELDINTMVEIFTQKLGQAEKENVLLQTQVIQMTKHIEELNEKIKDLETQAEELPELVQ